MKKSTQPAPQKVKSAQVSNTKIHQRGYRDLHEHLAELDKQGLLVTIDRPINKDTELHPLVRWQFRGGIAEPDRKAFFVHQRGQRQRQEIRHSCGGGRFGRHAQDLQRGHGLQD